MSTHPKAISLRFNRDSVDHWCRDLRGILEEVNSLDRQEVPPKDTQEFTDFQMRRIVVIADMLDMRDALNNLAGEV